MAKTNSPQKYYVYFDKRTGEIFSVSNERNTNYEHELVCTFVEVEKFLTGEWHFKDYLVGYKRTVTDETVLSVMPKVDDEYAFRNNVYEWIHPSKDETEVCVEWNGKNQSWYFSFSDKVKDIYNDGLLASTLTFFVTLETDFDFLIRTIVVDVQEMLLRKSVKVPFTSSFETDNKKISIGTRLVLRSYSLRIINE